ncbi:MAG: Bug family tripartite tricarboxylate transporter substrate binding protein [Xanthobacteraceae bacterium]
MTTARLFVVVILLAAVSVAAPACAQDYPNQLVRFISAFPLGSGADIMVRYFAEKIKPLMNQTVIVESKVGGGGTVSIEYIAKAKPDGYTVLVHSGVSAANMMYLLKNPPIDAARDIQMAAMINRQPFMVVVRADRPWKNVADLTAYLKEKKGAAGYGSAATIAKVAGEMYKQIAGLETAEVTYRAGPDMLNDLHGGSIDFAVLDPLSALAQARQGRIRILAVTTRERLVAVADLPTMNESGVAGMNLVGWFGAMVPSATPRPIVDKLNKWFNDIVATEETRKFLADSGGDPWVATVEQAQKFYLDEVKAWGDYVKLAKIEPQ